MDDELIPPSAFANRISQRNYIKQDENEFSRFSIYTDNFFQKINESSQTEHIRTINHGSCTTEPIFSTVDFQSKISAKKAKYVKKMSDMKQQCCDEVSRVITESDEINRKFKEVLREKDLVTEELTKMKFYISGIEDRDAWLKEKQRLSDEINCLQYTISDQKSIIDSMNVQLSSMEKIQSIQERELHKKSIDICSDQLSHREPNSEILLRAWRHKVLSLLVQQESITIVHNKDKYRFEEENQCLRNEILHLQSVLEQLNLRFDVQQAQLSTSDILVEKYKRESSNLNWKLQTISKEQEVNSEQLERIYGQLSDFCRLIDEEVFAKFDFAFTKIDSFHRRLDYANSRFPMILANVKRQRNMAGTDNRFEEEINTGTTLTKIQQLEEALVVTNKELKVLRQERDRLINTMEEDSATFFSRLNQKKEELKDEMDQLRATVSKYEGSISKLSKDLELMKQENYRLKADYDVLLSSKHQEADKLHESLTECRAELSRLSLDHAELNRTASQERKHLEEQIGTIEQRLIQCDTDWRRTCNKLSAERDLLKMTIRQDGILSKLKARTDHDQRPIKDKCSVAQGRDTDNIMKEVNELAAELDLDGDRFH